MCFNSLIIQDTQHNNHCNSISPLPNSYSFPIKENAFQPSSFSLSNSPLGETSTSLNSSKDSFNYNIHHKSQSKSMINNSKNSNSKSYH